MTTQPLSRPVNLENLSWTWQDHTIRYTVQGQGKPVLLIHGFGASIGHWQKNIPVLAIRIFEFEFISNNKSFISYCLLFSSKFSFSNLLLKTLRLIFYFLAFLFFGFLKIISLLVSFIIKLVSKLFSDLI